MEDTAPYARCYRLLQRSPNYNSWAGSGPPRSPIRQAVTFPKL